MKAQINGISLSYTDSGDPHKPPIVFVHGFPFNSSMWDDQTLALQNNYRVITYDQRGHGLSDAGDGQFPLEWLVDDLFGLLDFLHLTRVILAGLSMGGYVALRAIERNPERFNSLILCDTRSESDSNEAKVRRATTLKNVKTQGVEVFAEGFLKSIFSPLTWTSHPEIVERVRRVIRSNSPLGICGAILALAGRTDTTGSLRSIAIPTLILVGENDLLTPPDAARSMNKLIPGSHLEIIPKAGHMSNIENPSLFNEHLRRFLQTLSK